MSENPQVGKIGWTGSAVEDVEARAESRAENRGEAIVPIKCLASVRSCVISDPAGSTAALYQP